MKYEKFSEMAIVCKNLTAGEAASVMDHSLENCLKCPVLMECNPKTSLTVDRLQEVAASVHESVIGVHVLIVGRQTQNPEVCALSTMTLDTSRQIDLNSFVIPNPIASAVH